jgi:type VI protein secretion system component Hcp
MYTAGQYNDSPRKINMTKSKKKNVKVRDLKTKKDVKGGSKRRRRSHSVPVSDITITKTVDTASPSLG